MRRTRSVTARVALFALAGRCARLPEVTPSSETGAALAHAAAVDASPVVTRPATVLATPEPDASVPTSDPDEVEADVPWPSTWTDPIAIALLAGDCRARAPERHGDNLLECGGSVGRNCADDPCSNASVACQRRCATRCESCFDGCATPCEACRRACTGPACIRACAGTCAVCRDRCLRADDRCDADTCRATVARCFQEVRARWRRMNCPAECRAVQACLEAVDAEHRHDDCEARLRHRCPEDLFTKCDMGDPDEYPR